jgi:putative phosphoesterase
MKLGLISDVHADFRSLFAAVELLRDLGAERILCAGDLVERGPDGDMVVKFVQAEDIACAQGNHDVAAISNQAWLRENGDPANPNLRHHLLSAATLDFLRILPPTVSLEAGEQRVLVAHGTPWNNQEYVFPTLPPVVFRYIANETGADAVVLGHTHLPMQVQVRAEDGRTVRVLNPGSVAGPGYAGSHTCALLTLPALDFEVYEIDRRRAVAVPEITH